MCIYIYIYISSAAMPSAAFCQFFKAPEEFHHLSDEAKTSASRGGGVMIYQEWRYHMT